jgi:hypothetical protein
MTNTTINKIILSATTAMFLTACGSSGGGTAENQAPTANAGADTSVVVNSAIALTGSGTDTDGTIASYSWTDASGAVLATTASLNYTPTSVGIKTLTLTVTDDDGATAKDTVKITVTDTPNQAPTANAGADAAGVVNTAIPLTGSGTDTDGTIVSYSWTDASGAVLATTASFNYTPTSVGAKTLTLTVKDNDDATATDTVKITVSDTPNQVPTANAGADASVVVNTAITLTGSGTDTDGSIASYSWTDASGAVLATTASFAYTPITEGTDTLTFIVTDDDNATATDTVDVVVSSRFTDTNNTALTDTVTGLVWDKTASDVTACTDANKSVPTIEQFKTIIDYTKSSLAVVEGFNLVDDFTHYKTSDNWDILLKYGAIENIDTATKTICVDTTNYVAPAAVTFTKVSATDSNVTASNGLLWSDQYFTEFNYAPQTLTAATAKCTELGMRLPTLVELDSIYDRADYNISTGFTTVYNTIYWTSTVGEANASLNWVVNFDDNATSSLSGMLTGLENDDSKEAYVRCVK